MAELEIPQTIEVNYASKFHHFYVKDGAFDGYLPILIDDNIMFISDFKGTCLDDGTVKSSDVMDLTHSNFINFDLEENDPELAKTFEYEVTPEQEVVIKRLIATTAQRVCELHIEANL